MSLFRKYVPPFHTKSQLFMIFMSLLFSSYSTEQPQSWLGSPFLRCSFRLLYPIVKIAIITARIILHLISYRSSHMIYFICTIHLHIFHGNIWTQNWPAPNVSGFIAQLVERRTGIARSRVQAPLKSWIFFRFLYAIVKIAIITARIILHLI